jgi:hypothetical protein
MSEKRNRIKNQLKREIGYPAKKRFERKFLGKVKGFVNKEEARFERKHLKAYLAGKEVFIDGFELVAHPLTGFTEKRPIIHQVQQELNQL